MGLRPRKANVSAKHVKALHVDLETRRYAPEHNVLGNTPNTSKKDCQRGEFNHGVAAPRFTVSFASLSAVVSGQLALRAGLHVWIFHESHRSCTLLEMGTSPFLVSLR